MKQNILVLIVSLLIPILSFSQNIYPKITKDSLIVLTPLQLKQTNLIFVEHEYYKDINTQLEKQVIVMDSIINDLEMIAYYKEDLYKDNIISLENSYKVKIKKINVTCSIVISFLLVLCLM